MAYQEDIRTPLWNILKYINRFRERVESPQINTFPLLIRENKKVFLDIQTGHHLGQADLEDSVLSDSIKLSFHEFAILESPEVVDSFKLNI